MFNAPEQMYDNYVCMHLTVTFVGQFQFLIQHESIQCCGTAVGICSGSDSYFEAITVDGLEFCVLI